MRLYAYVAGAMLAFPAVAPAQDGPVTVSDVRVSADLTAVTSDLAATYWGTLETDLASAVAAEFVGQTAPGGRVIAIDIDEIALSSFFQSASGADDARLTGDVGVINAANEEVVRAFTVTATANQAASFLPAGSDVVTISPDSAEFYAAVVRAFARGVADTVKAGG